MGRLRLFPGVASLGGLHQGHDDRLRSPSPQAARDRAQECGTFAERASDVAAAVGAGAGAGAAAADRLDLHYLSVLEREARECHENSVLHRAHVFAAANVLENPSQLPASFANPAFLRLRSEEDYRAALDRLREVPR